MIKSKKILSVLLVIVLCLSTMMVSSLSLNSSADVEPLTAYKFETANYDASLASNDPTTVKASNNGSVNIVSDHIQHQYQMFFKVTDQQAMKDAIEETCEYYDGFLSVDISVNSAYTIYGSACRPTVSVSLMDKPHGNKIATTGENSLYSEQSGRFILDVSRFMEEEYVDQIKYIYVQVQCYNWGCGGGHGTQPDVTVYPIKVYADDMDEDIPTIKTQPVDPNQSTFFKFSPKAKNDDNNDPEQLHYSSDGAVWRSGAFAKEENYGYARLTNTLNPREQVQTSFNLSQMGDEAANALNLARQGSNYLKVSVTLQSCVNMQGEPTIAEVGVGVNTAEGIYPGDKPPMIQLTAWQYPGTTRTYYIDVSNIKHISQITNLVFRVQNYWYYRSGTNEMFDWNEESKYAGQETAEALGHVKCEIKPVLLISPVSVYKGDREAIKNTDYNLVLNDFNKNGGKVPEKITLVDPNAGVDGDDEEETTTAGVVTTTAGGGNNATTVTLPNGEHKHKYVWVVTKKATYFAKGQEVFKCVHCGAVSKAGTIKKKVLAAPKVTVKKSGKKIKVVYKKVKYAKGFQVRYRISGKWKLEKFKTKKSATRYTKAVKSGKYKVQVRAFITKGKKTAYGKWSAVKKVKI